MAKKETAASSIEIRLLGEFRVSVDGRAVPDSHWRQRKAALLLQRLVLEPHHRVHIEQLMGLLWPDAAEEAARNSLHKTIHLVRSALEPDLQRPADSHFLITRGQQLVLTAPRTLWIDVEEFRRRAADAKKSGEPEAFESALAVYGGSLLPDEPYEEWVTECRDEIERTYRQLLLDVAQLYHQRGESDLAVDLLQRLLAFEPANEAAHRALMQLHFAAGRRQIALRQFEHCREILRGELDAEPDEATVELYEQIARGEASRSLRLAVLPLENATGDSNLDYLCDGMTENIISSLSPLPRLQVMAHSTVSRYTDRDPRRVAQSLGVTAMLYGTFFHRRDELVVRVELIDATGSRLWGAEYEHPQQKTVEVQEQISSAISNRLGVGSEARGQFTRRASSSAEAYRLFLRGRHLWNKRTLEAVTKSIEYFQDAIAIDSEFPLAWIGIADSYAKLGDVGVAAIPPQEAFAKAKKAAVRAIGIDSSLAEGHATLAHLFMHEYDWKEAEREFRTAARLNPSYATTHHWFAYERLMTGNSVEAFEEIARALELDPLSVPINTDLGELLYFARDYDAAIEQYNKSLELDDRYYPIYLGLGRCYVELGEPHTAEEAFEEALHLSGESVDVLAAIAYGEALSNEEVSARHLLDQLTAMARTRYVSPYGIAAIHAALGDRDTAFTWLRRACAEHAAWSIYISVDPRLDLLRDDPRFPALLQSVGLQDSHAGLAI